jgi:hypothetical protein
MGLALLNTIRNTNGKPVENGLASNFGKQIG